jgi:DHA1 family tetracycline resistance protein-like MFS transporter
MIVGLAAGALTLAIYGLAPAGWIFLLGTPVGALLGLFAPGFQALTTRRVGPNEQGRLQGANSGITGLTSMIAPAAFGYIYAATAQREGGAAAGVAFLIAAVLLGLAALVVVVAVAPHAGASRSTGQR